jgi:hypothetical protein
LIQWQSRAGAFDLVVVNLAPQPSQCYVPLNIAELGQHDWDLRDVLGSERYERDGVDLADHGLYLDVPAHAAQLFHFRPSPMMNSRMHLTALVVAALLLGTFSPGFQLAVAKKVPRPKTVRERYQRFWRGQCDHATLRTSSEVVAQWRESR